MARRLGVIWIVGTVLAGAAPLASAQSQTVGLFVNDEQASDGYTLFGPTQNSVAYLINNDGLVVNQWETGGNPRSMYYLLANGHTNTPHTRIERSVAEVVQQRAAAVA